MSFFFLKKKPNFHIFISLIIVFVTICVKISNAMGEASQEEGWVVCRIFKKKNLHKTLDSPMSSSFTAETRSQMFDSCNGGALEQMLQYVGNGKEEEMNEAKSSARTYLRPIETGMKNGYHERFMKLPSLESPNSTSSQCYYQHNIHPEMIIENEGSSVTNPNSVYNQMDSAALTNWAALDRLVASQLNGQTEASRQLACFNDPTNTMPYCSTDHDLQFSTLRSSSSSSNRSYHPTQDYNSEIDLWSFARSSSSFSSSDDPLCHVSNAPV